MGVVYITLMVGCGIPAIKGFQIDTPFENITSLDILESTGEGNALEFVAAHERVKLERLNSLGNHIGGVIPAGKEKQR